MSRSVYDFTRSFCGSHLPPTKSLRLLVRQQRNGYSRQRRYLFNTFSYVPCLCHIAERSYPRSCLPMSCEKIKAPKTPSTRDINNLRKTRVPRALLVPYNRHLESLPPVDEPIQQRAHDDSSKNRPCIIHIIPRDREHLRERHPYSNIDEKAQAENVYRYADATEGE